MLINFLRIYMTSSGIWCIVFLSWEIRVGGGGALWVFFYSPLKWDSFGNRWVADKPVSQLGGHLISEDSSYLNIVFLFDRKKTPTGNQIKYYAQKHSQLVFLKDFSRRLASNSNRTNVLHWSTWLSIVSVSIADIHLLMQDLCPHK